MPRWTKWAYIEKTQAKKGAFDRLGIYQIRAVTPAGNPIPVPRLAGVDKQGILYAGRSGYLAHRSVPNRIREFVHEHHSGGITYARAKTLLNKTPKFLGHRLQVRAMLLNQKAISSAESKTLQDYFSKYGELPPCNSALPRPNRSE